MQSKEFYFKKIHQLIRKDIRDDINMGVEKPESHYINECKNHFSTLQSGLPASLGRFFGKSKKEVQLALEMWRELEMDLKGLIPTIILGVKADQMKTNINAVTTKALVKSKMTEAGLEFHFIEQRYRAKIEVRVSDISKLTFYLNYKKAMELLPRVIESAKAIRDSIAILGKTAMIGRISGWEHWE